MNVKAQTLSTVSVFVNHLEFFRPERRAMQRKRLIVSANRSGYEPNGADAFGQCARRSLIKVLIR